MMSEEIEKVLPVQDEIESIQSKIYLVRDQRVMLDFDLAKLYHVETKQLTRQVRRNIERFPEDFMFQITNAEVDSILRCHFGTSSWGGNRYGAFAFTEEGVAMLSGLLRSPVAVQVNINIMRAFVAMRKAIALVLQEQLSQEQINRRIDNIDCQVNEILRDQNDINEMQEQFNENISVQLELINQSLAELQMEKEESAQTEPIGYKVR